MRTILLLTVILTINSTDSFSQEKKSKPTKKEIKKAQKEFQKRISEESDGELIIIEPKLVDEFIESIKKDNMDKLYSMVDSKVKTIQSKADMTRLFGLYRKYFGPIFSYEQTAFGMKNISGRGQYATVSYDVVFEKYKGKATGAFKVYSKDTVKMSSFNIALDDYTIVDSFESIGKPIIEALTAKDKKQVYGFTSARFKEYNSTADFEERMTKILDKDLSDLKMKRHQFGLKEGNEALIIFYELKDNVGHLQLSFTKLADKFELEGLNYIPKE